MIIRDNPADLQAAAELKAIRKVCREMRPQDKATENAVRKILIGGMPTNWPSQDKRERAAIIAVMQLADELCRPPTGDETIDRMKRLRDEMDTMKPFLTNDGDRKNLADFLRNNGFGWLEFRKQGFQGNR